MIIAIFDKQTYDLMSVILSIIDTLSEEDKREFLGYLQKKNRRGDSKNLKLFKLIDSDKIEDLDIILYGKPSRNAYHALCKRLQDSLIDFVASKSFSEETSEEMEILKLLLASRIFFEYKKDKIAFKILTKAERIALSLDGYSILNEIHHTKIQYAHLNPTQNLPELFKASEDNMKHFQQERKLNMAYATIKNKLKVSNNKSVNDIISKTFSEFEIEVGKTLTYKSLFQLMNIVATSAKLQSNYFAISDFMVEIYGLVSEKQKEIKTDKHLFYHIEILNLMAVTHFRNKNFKASVSFSEKMETEMQKRNRTYYNRFLEKLTLIKAFNQNYTGLGPEAIEILKSFPRASFDVELSLIMSLFQQNHFQEAYSNLIRMRHSDAWYEKKMGWLFVLKKSIVEVLLLIELDKLDLVLSRLNSFKNKFSKRLKGAQENRVLVFMKLVTLYYEKPKEVTSKAFREKVEDSFEWIGKEREDIFVMSFYAWLKAKMENSNLYQTTLELAN
jgi:hypothetical protein